GHFGLAPKKICNFHICAAYRKLIIQGTQPVK
ncbi:MAG: hypothetical protein ACI8SA_002117, partial [Dokdonia sp.]